MRRGCRFALTMLCLTMVLTLTDWRWFHDETGADYQAAMLTHSEFFPASLMHRAKLIRQIEAPPADLPAEADVLCLARPCEFDSTPRTEASLPPPTDRDPLYAFMSMQV